MLFGDALHKGEQVPIPVFGSPPCARVSIEIVNSSFGKDLAHSLSVCGGPHEVEFYRAELGEVGGNCADLLSKNLQSAV
jgi:hypothetical protein